MEKQPVGLKLDQYFTKEEFIKYIEENITDEDMNYTICIPQMEFRNLLMDVSRIFIDATVTYTILLQASIRLAYFLKL